MANQDHLPSEGGGYVKVTRWNRTAMLSAGFALVSVAFAAELTVAPIVQAKQDPYKYPKRVAHHTEFQQVFYSPVNVTPTPATLTTTLFAPTVSTSANQNVTPAPATLTTTGYAPTVATPRNVIPGSESVITTVFAPSVTVSNQQNVTPGSATLTTTAFAPDVTVASAWNAAYFQNIYGERTATRKARTYRYALLYSGFSTNATGNLNVEPSPATLTITTYAPTVTVSASDTYTAAKFQNICSERMRSKKQYDPRREYQKWSFGLTDARVVMPAIEQLSQSYRTKARLRQIPLSQPQFGWRAPTSVEVTPTPASLTLIRFAPTVTVSGNQEVTPGTATLTVTRFAPTVATPRNIMPGPATLTATRFAPTVQTPKNVVPGPATLTATRFAPTIAVSGSQSVEPVTAILTLNRFAPTVVTSNPPVVDELPYGVPVKVWQELWTRPPMAFKRQAEMVFALDLSAVSIFTKGTPKALPKIIAPRYDKRAITGEVLSVVREHQRLREDAVRKEALQKAAQAEAVQKQIEEEEELYSLVLMLIDKEDI